MDHSTQKETYKETPWHRDETYLSFLQAAYKKALVRVEQLKKQLKEAGILVD